MSVQRATRGRVRHTHQGARGETTVLFVSCELEIMPSRLSAVYVCCVAVTVTTRAHIYTYIHRLSVAHVTRVAPKLMLMPMLNN